MPVQLVRQPDTESLARHAARDLVTSIAQARAERGVAHIGLAGGTTPMRTYELLDGQLDDWTGVHLWYGDERCVPFDDPESNHGQVKDRLRARGAVWHPMPATLGPAEGAIEYSRELGTTIIDIAARGHGPRRAHPVAVPRPSGRSTPPAWRSGSPTRPSRRRSASR